MRVRRAATSKLHETGLPQKAAEHRDAASAKASDLATQARHPNPSSLAYQMLGAASKPIEQALWSNPLRK